MGISEPTIVCEFGSPNSSQFIAEQSFPLNTWVHIIITFENGQLNIYQNNINILSIDTELSISTNNYNTRIGNRGNWVDDDTYHFEGKIAYLSYWNSVLSQEEIQNHMNCPPTGSETMLVGYWNFEEGEGETAIDLSGNDNNGIINGATYNIDVPEQSCQLTTLMMIRSGFESHYYSTRHIIY